MRLTTSGKTKKEYEKVCAYKKGALNNPSLRYWFKHRRRKMLKVRGAKNIIAREGRARKSHDHAHFCEI